MKLVMFDIIDAILFLIVLSLTTRTLIYFKIDFNIIYVVAEVLIVWVLVKMTLRRLKNKKKDNSEVEN